MLAMGYKQRQGDHILFIKHSPLGGVTALLVYVGDIIVTGDDLQEQQVLSKYLAKEFEIKTSGRLKYFLGIEVAHSRQGIFISQQKICHVSCQGNWYDWLQTSKYSHGFQF